MSWSSLGLEPSTSCMTVQHSTTWANQVRFPNNSLSALFGSKCQWQQGHSSWMFDVKVRHIKSSHAGVWFLHLMATSSPVSALVLLLFSPWNFKVPQNSWLALLHINYTEWVIDSITSFFSLSSDFFFSCA